MVVKVQVAAGEVGDGLTVLEHDPLPESGKIHTCESGNCRSRAAALRPTPCGRRRRAGSARACPFRVAARAAAGVPTGSPSRLHPQDTGADEFVSSGAPPVQPHLAPDPCAVCSMDTRPSHLPPRSQLFPCLLCRAYSIMSGLINVGDLMESQPGATVRWERANEDKRRRILAGPPCSPSGAPAAQSRSRSPTAQASPSAPGNSTPGAKAELLIMVQNPAVRRRHRRRSRCGLSRRADRGGHRRDRPRIGSTGGRMRSGAAKEPPRLPARAGLRRPHRSASRRRSGPGSRPGGRARPRPRCRRLRRSYSGPDHHRDHSRRHHCHRPCTTARFSSVGADYAHARLVSDRLGPGHRRRHLHLSQPWTGRTRLAGGRLYPTTTRHLTAVSAQSLAAQGGP